MDILRAAADAAGALGWLEPPASIPISVCFNGKESNASKKDGYIHKLCRDFDKEKIQFQHIRVIMFTK